MSSNELLHLRERLFSERKVILDRLHGVSNAVRTLSEPEIEVEEGVQKKIITDFYGQLGADAKSKVGLIDLALMKMTAGDFGLCESCEDDIPVKRLEAVPWARLCIDCAREHERKKETLPEHSPVIPMAKIPDAYAKLPKQELIKLIEDRIATHLDPEGLDIQISIVNGAVHLEGSLQSEEDRDTILDVLTGEMKIDAVLDLMQIAESSDEDMSEYGVDASDESVEDFAM
jgi:DnaK suppressor protein